MFDFGKLVVETAGEGTSDEPKYHLGQEGYFTIEDVPNPSKLARLILDLHREAMDKRGLISSISGAPQPPISETHTPPPA